MKKLLAFILTFAVLTLCFSCEITARDSPRNHESFNAGWRFICYSHAYTETVSADREPESLQGPSIDDNTWSIIDLPHDWVIEGPFSDTLENNTGLLTWKGIGGYRKHFTVSESEKDKRIYIDFDGAMANAKVWLNGKFIGAWPYGYTSFRLDLTTYVSFGKENVIAVRLDTKNWDSRWSPGAGLYGNVWLIKTSQVHIAHNGVFCTTPEVNKGRAIVSILAEVENHKVEPAPVTLEAHAYKLDRNGIPSATILGSSSGSTATIAGNKIHEFREEIVLTQPLLWDIDDPQLYQIVVVVKQNNG
jgi:beta-galactosidase